MFGPPCCRHDTTYDRMTGSTGGRRSHRGVSGVTERAGNRDGSCHRLLLSISSRSLPFSTPLAHTCRRLDIRNGQVSQKQAELLSVLEALCHRTRYLNVFPGNTDFSSSEGVKRQSGPAPSCLVMWPWEIVGGEEWYVWEAARWECTLTETQRQQY